MSDSRFDAFLSALARARTRREALAALASSLIVGAARPASVAAGELSAEACRVRNEKCKRKLECCSGRCRSRKGKKKRKCGCSPEGVRCQETSDCCNGDVPLFCTAGFCVRDRN